MGVTTSGERDILGIWAGDGGEGDRFGGFAEEGGHRYPAIESINAHYRRAITARGHFPNEASALKCLYLVTRSLNPTGGRAPWVMRWKPALNAFAITFAGHSEKTNDF